MKYFEDFTVGGRTSLPGRHQFTEDEIVEFARRWDPQPFHIDPVAAADSIFGGIVACSSHIIAAAISIASADADEPSAAVSALGFKEIGILAPVRPGDTLRSEEEVLSARLSNSHPGCGIVTFLNELFNQQDVRVCRIQTAALFHCKPAS